MGNENLSINAEILLVGSLIRHVMLVPQEHSGQYVAHVREANKPLVEQMIFQALAEGELMPKLTFIPNCAEISTSERFGEQHSVLDYFPRGSTKKLQAEKRLRVKSEHLSSETYVSTEGVSAKETPAFDYMNFLLPQIEEYTKPTPNRFMLFYDHDAYFSALIKKYFEQKDNENSRQKFKSAASSCAGGIVLAINNHDDFKLEWLELACELCFGEGTSQNYERSIIIIAADALRKHGFPIMERGAFETSVNDVVRVLEERLLSYLEGRCRHFIVVFQETGAMYIDLEKHAGKRKGSATLGPNCDRHAQMHPLVYGRVPGKFTSLVTSIIRELSWTTKNKQTIDIDGALRMSVAAYNLHYDLGFMKKDEPRDEGSDSRDRESLNDATRDGKGDEGGKLSPIDDLKQILCFARRNKLKKLTIDESRPEYLLTTVPFEYEPGTTPQWCRIDLMDKTDDCLIRIVKEGLEKSFRYLRQAQTQPQLESQTESASQSDALNFKPPAVISIPYSQYGELKLVDPEEIDKYASLAKLIDKYLTTPDWEKPLSIAVFGKPGSGKSFSVKQIIERINPDRKSEPLTFNLAQFALIEQLTEAFHKVQDQALATREVSLVVFDEFDSAFYGKLGWLKYFLAPMQDGVFRGKEAEYRVGRAIFLFAGGTSESFAEFTTSLDEEPEGQRPKESDNAELLPPATGFHASASGDKAKIKPSDASAAAKLPDFISRLRGHLDVEGINPEGEEISSLLRLRRAILLRSTLEKHAVPIFRPMAGGKKFANINDEVIRAFLCAQNYEHGSRSMEAIIQMSRFIDGHFVPASLPAEKQLGAHVNAESFLNQIKKSY